MEEQKEDQMEDAGARPAAIVAGFVLLALGAALFLDTTEAVHLHAGRLIGPFVLIGIGATMTLGRSAFVFDARRLRDGEARRRHRRRGGPTSGIWLIGVGVWMLVSQNSLFGLNFHNSWPLLIIFGGIIMVIRGLK
jgi:cell wall-active antibiotic response 4TMS protein YvqF